MNKYNLPPNHPLFLRRTEGEWLLEVYEDMIVRQKEYRDAIEALDASGATGAGARKERQRILDQLNMLNRLMGDAEEEYDPVVARWERDLAEGRTPDLSLR